MFFDITIARDANKAKERMDSKSHHLKTALISIDSTMSAAARTLQEAGRLPHAQTRACAHAHTHKELARS
jgi:hypothetical protein